MVVVQVGEEHRVRVPPQGLRRAIPAPAQEARVATQQRIGDHHRPQPHLDVNGDGATPLYQWMKGEAPGLMGSKSIKWNFTKFLIDREGQVVRRYAPTDKPEGIEKDISKLL